MTVEDQSLLGPTEAAVGHVRVCIHWGKGEWPWAPLESFSQKENGLG
jgi:hypothetical protein